MTRLLLHMFELKSGTTMDPGIPLIPMRNPPPSASSVPSIHDRWWQIRP